ncbi:MAG: PAS domain S-box protein [Spirochaetia bacterium]|nr:PAS domain S-box protein [Spirochaetia bacterium]
MKKFILIFAALIGMSLLILLDRYQVSGWQEKRDLALAKEAGITQLRLQNALTSRIHLTQYLKALVYMHSTLPESSQAHTTLTENEFRQFAQSLLEYNPALRALQLTDKNTQVAYVYPPKNNKIAITEPMLLIEDPLRGKYARKAIEERRMTVQPPFELRQGGLGIAARNPVFADDSFIGLAIAVIDVPTVIDDAFPNEKRSTYKVSLIDSRGNRFYHTIESNTPTERRTVSFADTHWTLEMVYKNPDASPPLLSRIIIFLFGGGFLFLLLLIIWILQNRTELLRGEVAKRTEELSQSEHRFRSIVADSEAGYFLIGVDGTYKDVNEGWLKMHEYSHREEIVGKPFTLTQDPEELERASNLLETLLKGERISTTEFSRITKSGQKKYHMCTARPVYQNGEVIGIEGFLFDITDRKKADQEKTFLMNELNHRVKNNLLMVNSLIRLKESALGGSVDLSDIRHQIDAIRIVHEKLYKTGEIAHINMRDYIQDLLTTIFSSFASQAVTLDSRVENIYINTKDAVALGLIINEIATNAIKYGFSTGDDTSQKAVFKIRMVRDFATEEYILSVSNSGNPFPEDTSIENSETLGLRLISILARQLDGTVELQKTPQALYTIRFPVP